MPSKCSLCHYPTWTTDPGSDEEYEVILDSFTAVQASAAKGCYGCIVLQHAWVYAIPDLESRHESQLDFNKSSEHLWIHIFGTRKSRGVAAIDLFTLPNTPTFKHVRTASLLKPSTDLQYTLPQIQSWLKSCRDNHEKCRESAPYMPQRLIDTECENPSKVKLVQLSSSDTHPEYACLSHCWGKTRSKHTTRHDTVQENFEGISISQLPKTFRDAVSIARSLAIRYLWIDSLCIIQDSASDWAEHVSKMADIYQNGLLTLAAGASSDDDGGFFADVPDKWTPQYKFNLDVDGVQYELHCRHVVDHPDADWPAHETLPLMERGWCFQERLLSKRYLCFGSKEVLWECEQEVACFCSVGDGPFNPRVYGKPSFPGCAPTKWQIAQLQGFQTWNYGGVWRNMVEEYSSRQLTFASDKLPALAGLADAFQQKVNIGTYLTGLWSHSLERDIAWHSYGDDSTFGRPRKEPSWTWASAGDGRISWPPLLFHDSYTVEPVICTQHQPETRTHVLKLSGLLLPLSIQTNAEHDDFEKVFRISRNVNVILYTRRHSEPLLLTIQRTSRLVPTLPGVASSNHTQTLEYTKPTPHYGTFKADYKFWKEEEELQKVLQHAIFFLIGMEPPDGKTGWGASFCWVNGMLLKPVDRKGPELDGLCRYERIGWLRYCTLKTREEWVPAGFRSNFLLV